MLLAVTGLSREARVISRPHLAVAVGGGNSETLCARIENALAAGARRIISMGVCGALSPALKVGDCVVATEIVSDGATIPTHASWTRELLARVPNARPGIIAGTDRILSARADKAQFYRATGADVADMESHVAARIAHARGLPFAALRIVSDSATQSLPPAALVAMAPDGTIDVCAVLRSLIANPRQIPSLVRTAFEAEKAFRMLFRSSHALDPAPALANLGELSLDVT